MHKKHNNTYAETNMNYHKRVIAMEEICQKFAKICKGYGLKKDTRGLWELFHCFFDTLLYISIDQFEKNDTNRFDIARLIKLFNENNEIHVKAKNAGSITITDGKIKTIILLFLHYLLQIESGYLYQRLGFASGKSKISGNYHFKDLFLSGWDLNEPYTDDELKKILEFEEVENEFQKGFEGNAGGKIPHLGWFVEKFLESAPSLFGKNACDEEFNMTPTTTYNLIGDLLILSGVVKNYLPKNWVEDVWSYKTKSGRRKIVSDWRKSYINAYNKSMNKTGMVSFSTPEGFVLRRKIIVPAYPKITPTVCKENILFYREIAQLAQEKELFDKLKF